jgi:hypothetical protein
MSFKTSFFRLHSETKRFSFRILLLQLLQPSCLIHPQPTVCLAPTIVRLLHDLSFLARRGHRLSVRHPNRNLSQQIHHLLPVCFLPRPITRPFVPVGLISTGTKEVGQNRGQDRKYRGIHVWLLYYMQAGEMIKDDYKTKYAQTVSQNHRKILKTGNTRIWRLVVDAIACSAWFTSYLPPCSLLLRGTLIGSNTPRQRHVDYFVRGQA